MRIRFVLAATAASVLSLSVLTPAMAIDPGQFEVSMDAGTQSQLNMTPDCTPELTSLAIQLATGGSVNVTCVMENVGPLEMNGTVTNPTMASTYGPAFATGTLAAICDTDQSLEMKMRISQEAQSLTSFKGVLFQVCSWEMKWSDAKSTTLAGTMEMNGKAGSDDGSVSSGNVDVSMTLKMYVTGGTGEFEGYVGEGEFTRSESIPVMGGALAGGAAAPGGLTPPTSSPSPSAPTSSSDIPAAVCTGLGLAAGCTSAQVGAICATNPAACAQISGLLPFAKRSVMKVLATAGAADGMNLNLEKAAGQVRILSPSAPAGKPGSAAKVKVKSAVEVVATAGSKCIVKNNKKKVVAAGTSVSSSAVLVMKPKKGAYTGAKTIQATCTNSGGSFKSNKVKVSM